MVLGVCVGMGMGVGMNEIFVNEDEDNVGKPLIIVPASSSKKFHFFYSKGEVKRLPNDFVFPQMTFCSLIVNWFFVETLAKRLCH